MVIRPQAGQVGGKNKSAAERLSHPPVSFAARPKPRKEPDTIHIA
jgi:hypothetical protein